MLLDPDTLTFVHQRTVEIKALIHRTTRNLIEIGQKLLEVKERLGHGRFGEWLASEFEASQDTAERLINIAKRLGDIPHNAEFEAKALYLLAAASTPQSARIEAITLAESGEAISHSRAKAIVERHKADDEDVVKLEAIAAAATEVEPNDDSLESATSSRPRTDSFPFHCLLTHTQRERLFGAI